MQAEDIDAQIVGCDALAMEGVDATDAAEVMASCLGVELILSKRFLARHDPELAFVNLHHKRVLSSTN